MSEALSLPQLERPALTSERLKLIVDTQSGLAAVRFDLDAFMKLTVDRTQALTNATGATIELVDGDEMVYAAASGSVEFFIGFRLLRSKSLSGMCVRKREVMISEDTSCDPRVDGKACKQVGAASMIVVPLFRLDEAIGVLKVLSTKTHAFTSHDVETLRLMADLLGSMLGQQIEFRSRAQEEEVLRHQAQYDALTGLPNRVLFRDRLEHAIHRNNRNAKLLALFYMDLDGFKKVNDTLGHDAGDTLLRLFSARTEALIRKTDTLARLGGDEFALILEDIGGVEDIERIGQVIVKASSESFDLGAQKVNIGISIGCAIGFNTKDPAQLIKNADTALYDVKRAGRNGFRIYKSGE